MRWVSLRVKYGDKSDALEVFIDEFEFTGLKRSLGKKLACFLPKKCSKNNDFSVKVYKDVMVRGISQMARRMCKQQNSNFFLRDFSELSWYN